MNWIRDLACFYASWIRSCGGSSVHVPSRAKTSFLEIAVQRALTTTGKAWYAVLVLRDGALRQIAKSELPTVIGGSDCGRRLWGPRARAPTSAGMLPIIRGA